MGATSLVGTRHHHAGSSGSGIGCGSLTQAIVAIVAIVVVHGNHVGTVQSESLREGGCSGPWCSHGCCCRSSFGLM